MLNIENKSKYYFNFKKDNLTRKRILQVNNLSLYFFNKPLLKGISFEVFEKEKIAIYGDSGSGKTLLILCMAGFLEHKGEIIFYEKADIKLKIGVSAIENIKPIFEDFDIFEILEYYAKSLKLSFSNDKIKNFLKLFEISNKSIKDLSAVEKAFISFLIAYISDPEVLLLDEITKELSEDNMIFFWKKIEPLIKEKTLIFTTKRKQELMIANRVLFIEKGELNII
ncbi:MAG: ATP-binding cassette domain-containing protein [Candidatus Woesearchaeota archaeon]